VETNLSLRDYRQNQIVKKVSSWAAIIAVPALITGYYGMNVSYPGSGHLWGVVASTALMVPASAGLYLLFRRQDRLCAQGSPQPFGSALHNLPEGLAIGQAANSGALSLAALLIPYVGWPLRSVLPVSAGLPRVPVVVLQLTGLLAASAPAW
jgi:hypothetical protein